MWARRSIHRGRHFAPGQGLSGSSQRALGAFAEVSVGAVTALQGRGCPDPPKGVLGACAEGDMQRTTRLTRAVSKQGEEVVYDTENLDAEHIWWECWHVGQDCSMQLWRRALGRLRQRLKHSGVCVVSWHGDRGKSRLVGAGDLCCRKGVYLTKWQQRGFHGRHSLVFMVHNCKQLHDRMHGHCPRKKR